MDETIGDQAVNQRTSAEAVFERMSAYVRDLEHTPPPVFVGREYELDELAGALERVASANPRRMARVVQGVPGAGKSSLCDEFMANVQGQRMGSRRVLCAQLDPSDLDLPPLALVGKLTETLPKELALVPGSGRFAASTAGTLRKLASTALQVGFRTSEYRLHNETHGLSESSDLGTCIASYAQHMWPEDICVVLALDEMQSCPITDRTASTFRVLNERVHDSCIFVVCFGLQNTAAVIREHLGISRMSDDAVMEIGPLHQGEGRQVLERTLDHLGVSAENEDWWGFVQSAGFHRHSWQAWRTALVDDLEVRSSDFPQHLTAALRSVCSNLIHARSDYSPAHDLLAEIADRHESNKAGYYEQRIGTELGFHLIALAAVAKAAAGAQDAGGIALRDAVAAFEAGDDLHRPVDTEKALDLVALAVRRGVLRQSRSGGPHRCLPPPIPSMTIYLSDGFDRELARGDEVAAALAKRFGFERP